MATMEHVASRIEVKISTNDWETAKRIMDAAQALDYGHPANPEKHPLTMMIGGLPILSGGATIDRVTCDNYSQTGSATILVFPAGVKNGE
jgi:hypothetical protein